jgi:pimeloyl-ACP methyl ester carboxylesterase
VNPVRSFFVLGLIAVWPHVGAAQTQPTGATPALSPLSGPEPRRSVWNGYDRIDFTLAGRNGVLVVPKTPAPGRPWIWRTEFFDHQPQVDLALLARGWHLVYADLKDMYGSRRSTALMGEFYAHLVTQAQLAPRMVLEGFSRGGLSAFNFAATHPSRVAALYLDAPVLDVRSWPGRDRSSKEWAQFLEANGLNEQTFAGYRGNPVDRIQSVANAKIPIIVVCGDADTVVPMAENTAVLEKRYRELGGTIEVIVKRGVGHHPHSLEDPTRVVEFLTKHARL